MPVSIYQNKTILITGHTGFKGSWLAALLHKSGANVIGFSDRIFQFPNHFEFLKLDMISVFGDIRDLSALKKTIDTYKPEIVFHFAAQALVRESYANPIETLTTNIIGTANVFEACRASDYVRAIVNVTSDKCYQNDELAKPFTERDCLGGNDVYSVSKACAEIVTSAYRKSFYNSENQTNTLIATMRAGNVIGGGDWAADRLIPDIVRSISGGKTLKIRNPNAVRPWQHVLDPLRAYLLVGEQLLLGNSQFAQAWNVAPLSSETHSVGEVVTLIKKQWDVFDFEYDTAQQPHEAGVLRLDSEALHTALNWQPVWNFEQSIEQTTAWYKAFYENTEIITEKQIDIFLNYENR